MFAAPATYMWPFFESRPGAWNGGFLDAASFDVASDAFATLKDLLTRHKSSGVVKGFLEANYERLFGEPEDQVGSSGSCSSTAPIAVAAVAVADAGANQPRPPQTPILDPPLPACPPTAMNPAPEGSPAAVASEGAGGAGAVDATSSGNVSSSSCGHSISTSAGSGGTAASVDVRACRLVGLYGGLLGSERNFFTRRQSLKLLAELLLDRTNFAVSSGGFTLSFPPLLLFAHAYVKVIVDCEAL